MHDLTISTAAENYNDHNTESADVFEEVAKCPCCLNFGRENQPLLQWVTLYHKMSQ